jgi:hypothetical protein
MPASRSRKPFKWVTLAASLLFALSPLAPQDDPSQFDTTGQATVDGRTTRYVVRHLPPSAYPQIPLPILDKLTSRGCLIPQTYEAHQPENVVHASLEHAGSSDWAVLCSVTGTVSLLVFFGSGDSEPLALATAQETARLQAHGADATLGFNWAIDPATPDRVHQAQRNMHNPPPRPDHDALADSVLEGKTVYRFFANGSWTTLETQD